MNKGDQLILVLDAETSVRESTVTILELEGYRVAAAGDGVTGLAEARKFRPDAIVCNVPLPGLDGFGVFEALRTDVETSTIPVVFVALRQEMDSRAAPLGIKDYILKPFDVDELLNAIAIRLQCSID